MKRSGFILFLLPILLSSFAANAVIWAPPSLSKSMSGQWSGKCSSPDGTKLSFSLEEQFYNNSVKTRNFELEFDDVGDQNSFSASRGNLYHGGDQLAPKAYARDYGSSFVTTSKGQLSLSLRMSNKRNSAQLSLSKAGQSIYRAKAMSCKVSVNYN